MSLSTIVAAAFRHTRKEWLKKNEFVYYLAFDRKWMSLEVANELISRAKDAGLINYEGDVIQPLFNVYDVTVPVGFRPGEDLFHDSDPVEDLASNIAVESKQTTVQVIARMNELIKDHFSGNLYPEAAIVIVAKKYGVPFSLELPILLDRVNKET